MNFKFQMRFKQFQLRFQHLSCLRNKWIKRLLDVL